MKVTLQRVYYGAGEGVGVAGDRGEEGDGGKR